MSEPAAPGPARTYRPGALHRLGNPVIAALIRAGVGPPGMELLTTRGRRTGRPRTTPVTPVGHGGRRWLVAPYGVVGWVRNARASGTVTLRRGSRTRDYDVREVGADEAGPVLKRYVQVAPIVLPYFHASRDAPVERFAAEAHLHPVFELVPRT